MASRPVAQLLARVRAVSGTQDVAQVGFVLKRVGMLFVVAGGAGAGGRLLADLDRLFQTLLGHVLRSGTVADLALHVAQVLRVAEAAPADLAVTGDVTAHALVVVLFAAVDQRLPGGRMHGLLPECGGGLVATGALVIAHVVRPVGFGWRRRLRVLEIDRGDLRVQLAHPGRDFAVAGKTAAQRDQAVREIRTVGRLPRRAQLAALREQGGPFVALARDERLVAAARRGRPGLQLLVDARDGLFDLHAPQRGRLGAACVGERTRRTQDQIDPAHALQLVRGGDQERVADPLGPLHSLAHLTPEHHEVDT